MTIAAEIIQVGDKMGIKGVSRIRCRVLEGKDKDKVLVRNTVGPIRVGDIILLKETAMEAEAKMARR